MKWMQRRARELIVSAASAAALSRGAPALADLGGSTPSVKSDQVHLHATLRQVALATHIRHELALPNGAAVHEYSNSQGQVFAIRWAGPGKPDLRSLLGSHFGALQAANAVQSSRGGQFSHIRGPRRPLMVDSPDLRIESGGHMGYFWGLAWLPALMPTGVQPGDLQ